MNAAWARAAPWLAASERVILFTAAFALAGLVYAQFRFWELPALADTANWDYVSQIIARGGVPYRDVVHNKTPLSAYLSAAGVWLVQPFGLADIQGMRLMVLLMGMLSVGFSYLVARDFFERTATGILAALIMLGFDNFIWFNCSQPVPCAGTQPKLPVVLFGLLTLWAARCGRPFIAGMSGMLAALSWQPGLLFVGVAGLAFSRYLTTWRDGAALKVIAGAVLPLAVLLAYFWTQGALRDFYVWTIVHNASVYGPKEFGLGQHLMARIIPVLGNNYAESWGYSVLAIPGMALFVWGFARLLRSEGARVLIRTAPQHAILIAPLAYLAFCLVDFQGQADFIPMLPFVAIFSALALTSLASGVARLVGRRWVSSSRMILERGLLTVLAGLVFAISVADAFSYRPRRPTLADQRGEVQRLLGYLQPGDKIFTHDYTGILVLGGLTGYDKYFIFDSYAAEVIDSQRLEPDGSRGWFERFKASKPRIVAVGPHTTGARRVAFYSEWLSWLEKNYDRNRRSIFTYYVRRN